MNCPSEPADFGLRVGTELDCSTKTWETIPGAPTTMVTGVTQTFQIVNMVDDPMHSDYFTCACGGQAVITVESPTLDFATVDADGLLTIAPTTEEHCGD